MAWEGRDGLVLRNVTQEDLDYIAGWSRVACQIRLYGRNPRVEITIARLCPDFSTAPFGVGSRAWFAGEADAWCASIGA